MANVIKAYAEVGARYSNVILGFTGRRKGPAKIDTTTKPVVSSIQTPGMLTIESITPIDPVDGLAEKFKAVIQCGVLKGVAVGEFRADRDITPAGEQDLVIPFEITIGDPLADEATLELGEPDGDEPPVEEKPAEQ